MKVEARSTTSNRQARAWQSFPMGWKLAVWSVVALVIWLPRAAALDRFLTPDENAWSGRSEAFLAALRSGDYNLTFQTEHPGVTTMWAGSVARLAGLRMIGVGAVGLAGGDLSIAAGRTVAALVNALSLSLAFAFAWRLFGLLPACLGFLLIALDPFHVAHSRILHLDGMLSSFLLLALLAFLSFLRYRSLPDLIVSGVAAGLSWLTKSPSLFLIPVVLLLALVDLAFHLRSRDRRPLAALIWQSVWPLIIWGLAGMVVFIALWPAMWVDPLGTMTRVLTPVLGHAQGGHGDPVFFGGRIYADGRIDASVWQFYPLSYLWRSTPVVLLGFLATGVAVVFGRGLLALPEVRRPALALVLFAVLYGLLMNLGAKKFDRYLLPAFAPLDLVAAVGWIAVAGWIAAAIESVPLRRSVLILLLGVAVLGQAASALPSFPYYLSYYNPLLGGGQRAPEKLMIGWGEGLDQAGRYLSDKPGSQQLQVASWYVTCFGPYFTGSVRGIPLETDLSEPQVADLLGSDYVVVYIHQWQRQMPRPLLQVLAKQTPEHRVVINGVEYVRIYPGHSPE